MSLPIAKLWVSLAGDHIRGPGTRKVFANGLPISLLLDSVVGHGGQEHPPSSPIIITASRGKVFADGMPVCRTTDNANCGHSVISSSNVFAG